MKKTILLFTFLFLLSCGEDDPCDKEYQLNEPGGFGRNEVTFLINGETVWHSSKFAGGATTGIGGFSSGGFAGLGIFQNTLKDEDGKTIKDSLNNPIYIDTFSLRLDTRNSNNCEDYYFKNFESEMFLYDFNENDTLIDMVSFSLVNYFIDNKKQSYSVYRSETFKANIHWNRKDSLIHGTFEGVLYNYSRTDSIKITNGVFDYRYKAHNFHGEIK